MALPEAGYTQPVEIVVGGTLPRNGYVQPVEVVAGATGMIIGAPVVGGTPGSVLFVDAAGNLGQNNAAFFWSTTNLTLSLSGAAAANSIFTTQVSGDANKRLAITADGTFSWGPGNIPADVSLNRSVVRTLTVSSTGAGVALSIDDTAGTTRDIFWSTALSPRWILRTGSAAESGGNAGSDFFLLSRTDGGAPLRTDLTLTRSTGTWAFGGQLSTAGPVNVYTVITDAQPASQLSAGRMSQGPGGATALDMYLQRVAGSISGAWEMGPLNAGGNMQLQLVPSATVPIGGITSQIILFNVIGANFERFAFTCVNGGYVIDSTINGAGSLRPISMSFGSTGTVVLNANPTANDGSTGAFSIGTTNWDVLPRVDDSVNFGSASFRWQNIRTSKQILAADGTDGAPSYAFASEAATGFRWKSARLVTYVFAGGPAAMGFDGNNYAIFAFKFTASSGLVWLTGADAGVTGTVSTTVGTDGAATLFIKNATTSQNLRIYGTTTGSRYLNLTHDGTSGIITHTGTGQIGFGTAALATNATTGYLCIPTCAGVPTGVPANIPTGQVPVIYDTTDNKIYVYSSGWKRAQVTAVDAIYA
jgi:hypothetical protein